MPWMGWALCRLRGLRLWRSFIIFSLYTSSLSAGTFVAYGPETLVRSDGAPIPEYRTFKLRSVDTSYVLQLMNGGLEDSQSEQVSSSLIIFNGADVFTRDDFNQKLITLEAPVVPVYENRLDMVLYGKPGGRIQVQLVGIDNAPPLIRAIYSVEPNNAGWFREPVSIDFICDDLISGIALCSESMRLDNDGIYPLTGKAVDEADNVAVLDVLVKLDQTAPLIDGLSLADGEVLSESTIQLSGVMTDDNEIVEAMVNGVAVELGGSGLDSGSDAPGTFSVAVTLNDGANVIVLSAVDVAGNVSSMTLNITLSDPLPDDPVTIAPSLNTTAITSLFEATAFLYQGDDAIQQGMAEDVIEPARVAVLRGVVRGRDGKALSGVDVTIHGQPEFGSTMTRADGMFDMAVNGGASLTVEYQKAGYITVQRRIETAWRDYVWLPEVMMLPLDSRATAIALASSELQVARASEMIDGDGRRQLTMLFPAGLTASMIMEDGERRVLNSLTVRATEFTVGEKGGLAMPADLPPESGYTYAVELSVDEARDAGALTVEFSKPVPVYLENFLGFPVGTAVPSGYYDRQESQWQASDDGRVIAILAIDDQGYAELDIDGSGVAASTEQLAAFAVSDAERLALAEIYSPGESLWRVPIPHFSAWDFNLPWGLPFLDGVDAYPNPEGTENLSETEDNNDTECGSVIACQNQTLGEVEAITGTPFTLNYSSDRVAGRAANYTLDIPLTGDVVHSDLLAVELDIYVAGQRFSYFYGGLLNSGFVDPNLSHRFVWDGLDAYGRKVQGSQRARVRISYVYIASYYTQPSGLLRTFAKLPSGSNIVLVKSSAPSGDGSCEPIREGLMCNGSNRRVRISDEREFVLGGIDAQVMGIAGWTLNIHHQYDALRKRLNRGDGSQRSAQVLPDVITTVAGNGQAGASENGVLAIDAMFDSPLYVAATADGSLYVADKQTQGTYYYRITRIAPDGRVYLVTRENIIRDMQVGPLGRLHWVGSGQGGYIIKRLEHSGEITNLAGGGSVYRENGLATDTWLDTIGGFSIALDGSLYISETRRRRLHKVTPDGIIYTLAGAGPIRLTPYIEDGVLAKDVKWNRGPSSVLAADDGTVYLVLAEPLMIWRIGTDGRLEKVAGKSFFSKGAEGANVSVSNIPFTRGLKMTASGDLVFVDERLARVMRIDGEQRLWTVAGEGKTWYGEAGSFAGDGGAASKAMLNSPHDITIDKDGYLYIADTRNHRIRRVGAALPGYRNEGAVLVASQSGGELYQFDAQGRHIQTLHGLTGAVIYHFNYDADGHLIDVVDGDDNVTRIEWNGAVPLAVVSEHGQRTELIVGEHGYLSDIIDPAGEVIHFDYDESGAGDGLLVSRTDGRGFQSQMDYDVAGRLVSDVNAVGGGWQLQRQKILAGYQVQKRSALGYLTIFNVKQQADGGELRVTQYPDGTVQRAVVKADGTKTIRYADGSRRSLVFSGDQRFGLQVPIADSNIMRMPSGLTQTTQHQRRYVYGYDGLQQQIDTIINNGRVSHEAFDVNTYVGTSTSPMGRITQLKTDEQGRALRVQATNMAAIQYQYDAQGRLASESIGEGMLTRSTRYQYDLNGYVASMRDPLGRETFYDYDAAGNRVAQTLPDGRHTDYNYDSNGNLVGMTLPSGARHRFRYTAINKNSVYLPPELSAGDPATYYDFNLDGQLTVLTRADGMQIKSLYDEAGRVDKIHIPGGYIDYLYDAQSGLINGLDSYQSDVLVQNLSYRYDGSLPISETWTGAVQGEVKRQYDNNFWMRNLTIVAASVETNIALDYDDDGLLIKAGDVEFLRNIDNGVLERVRLGGVETVLTNNDFGEMKRSESQLNNNQIYSEQLNRDLSGRITGKTETIGNDTHNIEYSYDAVGRLIEVRRDAILIASYQYDENGNRIGGHNLNGNITASYDAQDRMTFYGGVQYLYSPNGELNSKNESGAITQYDYDVFGSLRKVILPGDISIEYLIDGRNRRIGKKLNGQYVQGFLYQDQLNPVAELDASGAIRSVFIYGSRLNVPDYMQREGQTYRIISDHLGSPRLVVNINDGIVAQRIDYDEFGNVLADSNPGFQPFGFAGGLYDAYTGLVRFGARDYDAHTGRWTNKDPIKFAAGDVNLYGYVFADPVNFLDQTGEFVQVAMAVIGGSISAYNAYASGAVLTEIAAAGALGAYSASGVGSFVRAITSGIITGGLGDLVGRIAGGGSLECLSLKSVARSSLVGGIAGGLGNIAGLANALRLVRGGVTSSQALVRGKIVGVATGGLVSRY